jgi:hypothetical protein
MLKIRPESGTSLVARVVARTNDRNLHGRHGVDRIRLSVECGAGDDPRPQRFAPDHGVSFSATPPGLHRARLDRMDVATIDQEYQQLQQEAGTLTQALQDFATKLQTAGSAGDSQAQEWVLDLKGVALQIQQEQLQMQALLMALHDFVGNAIQQQQQPAPTAPAPQQAAPPEQPAPQQGSGTSGLLSHFRGSNFGQSMTQGVGMGVGFGLADSVINSIFN